MPVVVMEMMSYAWVPCFISICAAVSKFEEWRSKCLRLFVVVVVIETMYYAYVPSITSMRAIVSKFEEWRYSFKENCLRLFQTICGRHGNMLSPWKWYNRHTYQVSSLCVLPLESLRSEEVNLKKSAWGYLLLFTNMYCCNFCVGYWIHYVYKLSFT